MPPQTRAAIWRLTLSTAAWGLSFPAAKAVMLAQSALLPGRPDWFHAAFILMNRMLISVLAMMILFRGQMRGFQRSEWIQGIQLGLFGGLGMLLQTDAQHHIAASTSAFFTQFTSVFVPIYVAIHGRRFPSWAVVIAAGLVVAGCAVLSGVELGNVHLGRGEWETILSAMLFTGQIVTLERPVFQQNDMRRTATIMFGVKGVLLLPLVVAGGGSAALQAYGSWPVMAITIVLALFCTTYAYATMVRWQPHVTSTQAGLIYATEPIFATLWALFLPGWFSALAGIVYANEHLTSQFYVGAALIFAANVAIIFAPQTPKPEHPI
jgi:drug/metabolite transporter (DMT)-like permease